LAQREEEKGRGVPGFGAVWRRKQGRESGDRAQRGTSQAASVGPRPVGASGVVAARQGSVAWRDDASASD
jgi:hypothetical protein